MCEHGAVSGASLHSTPGAIRGRPAGARQVESLQRYSPDLCHPGGGGME